MALIKADACAQNIADQIKIKRGKLGPGIWMMMMIL